MIFVKDSLSIEELVARGVDYAAEGKRIKAQDCFRKALAMLPEDPVISYNLALELMYDESWGEALELLNHSVNGDPENPDYWCERGVVLYNLERYDEAEEAYDLALTYGGENSRIWNSLGVLRFVQEAHEDAALFFRRALELDARNPDAWFNLADTLEELGQEKEAREAKRVFDSLFSGFPE